MKHYIFTAKESKASYCVNVTLRVYRIKNNKPVFIGNVGFNSGATKGAESEVFRLLQEQKEITLALYKSTNGYYNWKMKESGIISITEIL